MHFPELFETANPFLYSLMVAWFIIFLFWHSAGRRERQQTKHALHTLATLNSEQSLPATELALWKLPPPNATQKELDDAFAEFHDHYFREQERKHALQRRLQHIQSVDELKDFLIHYQNARLQEIEDHMLLEEEPGLGACERTRSGAKEEAGGC